MDDEGRNYCPECRIALASDIEFCPVCGARVEAELFERPMLLTAASVMAMGSALIIAFGAIFYLIFAIGVLSQATSGILAGLVWVLVPSLNVLGFVLGIAAGSWSWTKSNFRGAALAAGFLPFVGLLNLAVLQPFAEEPTGFIYFLALATSFPLIFLSLASFVFIVIKQQEFT